MNRIDVTGMTFGRLKVIGDASPVGGRRRVLCQCACGQQTVVEPRLLRCGKTRSCGCLQREAVAASCVERSTHRHTGTPEYVAWVHMKARCDNPNDRKYADYGARGIVVCAPWRDSFEAFLADMGHRPARGMSIDRIDVNGHYEADNCRWATAKTQSRNKRSHRLVTFMGAEMPLSEACELAGVNYRSALYRLNNGSPWMPLPPPPTPAAPADVLKEIDT